VLLVTHDVEEAILLADRIIVLKQGRIAEALPIV
jgi:sulfonate transport system ATP-binding protein